MKKILVFLPLSILAVCLVTSCANNKIKASGNDSLKVSAGIVQSNWGETDGKKVYLYTLTNSKGNQVSISNYGATITSWKSADKTGHESSIVLGFDSLSGYLAKPPYFGATIGRYGNRIKKGSFNLDGKTYTLATNNGVNHLHGGNKGFDKVIWEATPAADGSPSIVFAYTSKDGEEGYPGNLMVKVTFTLKDADALEIKYNAETDKPTVLNLTNHSYFNLSGDVNNTIYNEVLFIDADKYTAVDSTLIPTGQLPTVKGTPMDFTTPATIGSRINQVTGGYDHNYVLNKKDNSMQLAAFVVDSTSGRKLEVFTTEPGIQFYSGNFLDGSIHTSAGVPIKQHAAFCLETQHFPDSPNNPAFPSVVLRPGEKYNSSTIYKLSILP